MKEVNILVENLFLLKEDNNLVEKQFLNSVSSFKDKLIRNFGNKAMIYHSNGDKLEMHSDLQKYLYNNSNKLSMEVGNVIPNFGESLKVMKEKLNKFLKENCNIDKKNITLVKKENNELIPVKSKIFGSYVLKENNNIHIMVKMNRDEDGFVLEAYDERLIKSYKKSSFNTKGDILHESLFGNMDEILDEGLFGVSQSEYNNLLFNVKRNFKDRGINVYAWDELLVNDFVNFLTERFTYLERKYSPTEGLFFFYRDNNELYMELDFHLNESDFYLSTAKKCKSVPIMSLIVLRGKIYPFLLFSDIETRKISNMYFFMLKNDAKKAGAYYLYYVEPWFNKDPILANNVTRIRSEIRPTFYFG